jgi:hypothetical protein
MVKVRLHLSIKWLGDTNFKRLYAKPNRLCKVSFTLNGQPGLAWAAYPRIYCQCMVRPVYSSLGQPGLIRLAAN